MDLSLKGLILEDINHMLNEFSCYGFSFQNFKFVFFQAFIVVDLLWFWLGLLRWLC
jgi:hypothetical protein